uniref:Uncharacterized protein n=1 Tax=Faecalibaculum rodentium TaxID=1702221 RepID=A0A140DXM5_9FIRM|nr:hypothetical protein AALO17_22680 [Faecalibaculum rodentium]
MHCDDFRFFHSFSFLSMCRQLNRYRKDNGFFRQKNDKNVKSRQMIA